MNQTTRKPSEILQLILDKGLYKPEKPSTFMCCIINDAYCFRGLITRQEVLNTRAEVRLAIKHRHLLGSYLRDNLNINPATIEKYPFIKTLFYKGLIKRLKAQGK